MHIEHIPGQPPFVTSTGPSTIGIVEAGVYGAYPVRVKVDTFTNAVGQKFMRRVVGNERPEWSMVVGNDRFFLPGFDHPIREEDACPLGQRCQFVTGRFAYGRR